MFLRNLSSIICTNLILNGLPKGPQWPKPIAEFKNGNPKQASHVEQTKFIKTYLQSLEAEDDGLDEIAEWVIEKPLNILVKDWAIKESRGKT